MREEFTKTLHDMLSESQREARQQNQDFVGTEHLFLGLLHCGECEAARALQKSNVNRSELMNKLQRLLPKGEQPPVVTGDLPFSPKAQRAINGAMVKAQSMRQPKVSTRFVLLSLIDEPQTVIRDALHHAGADVEQLQRLLAETPIEGEN